MRLVDTYSAANGLGFLSSQGQLAVIKKSIESAPPSLTRGSGPSIKAHIETFLADHGWATNVRIDAQRALTINAFHHSGIALQVQVGNIARAFYDLLKLESVVRLQKVKVGVLVVPTKEASRLLGDNLSNFERLSGEHRDLFNSIVNMPLVILGFE
jgi:hypothetical protein